MDRKTVIAGLKAYRRIDDAIRQKIRLADELADDPSKGSPYREEAANLRRVKREIVRCLNTLPGVGGEAVFYHYVKGWIWVRVARKCAYSERQIRGIAVRSLIQLGEAFDSSPEIADFCRRAAADTI